MSEQDEHPYGLIRDGKVFLKAQRNQPERQVGEVRTSAADALAYFGQRFQQLADRVEGLISDIDRAQNKGSYLMKLLHLRRQLPATDALGDFDALHDRLTDKEQEIQALIDQNRIKNLEVKRTLLLEAETLRTSTDWKATAERLKELKARWLKTGAVSAPHAATLEEAFAEATEAFFERRKAYFADRNELINLRVERYEALIREAEALRETPLPAGRVVARLKALHEAWKQVGGVPKARSAELWSQFKRINDDLYQRCRQDKGHGRSAARDQYLQTNLQIKQQLCTEAASLAEMPLNEALARAKELQAHWKNTGPIPPDQRPLLNEAFVTACDRVFEHSHLLRVVQARHGNYRQKPPAERVALALAVLRELIRKDETELDTFEHNFAHVTTTDQNQPISRMITAKLRAQRRKLNVKRALLTELQSQGGA